MAPATKSKLLWIKAISSPWSSIGCINSNAIITKKQYSRRKCLKISNWIKKLTFFTYAERTPSLLSLSWSAIAAKRGKDACRVELTVMTKGLSEWRERAQWLKIQIEEACIPSIQMGLTLSSGLQSRQKPQSTPWQKESVLKEIGIERANHNQWTNEQHCKPHDKNNQQHQSRHQSCSAADVNTQPEELA